MKNLSLILTFVFLSNIGSAQAQGTKEISHIEIKGIQVGMPKSDVELLLGGSPYPKPFSIAGIFPKTPSAILTGFIDGKLSSFTFLFNSGNFSLMQSALKEKYPQLTCETSEVKNRAGATFEEVKCKMNAESGNLLLSKFYLDLNTSALVMMSVEEQEKIRLEIAKRKKDI